VSKGRKTIQYNGNKYFIKRLVELHKADDLKHLFSSGECIDESTGEVFDISDINKVWMEKYSKLDENSKEVLDYNKHRLLNKSVNGDINEIRKKELESKYNNANITKDELVELIILKYNNYEIYLTYDNYVKLNKQIPDLSDADLGKFYKILNKLTHKANTLLNKNDTRSNPMNKNDISECLGLDIKPTERYLKKLKDKSIIKSVTIGSKSHYMINPLYAFNGSFIGSYTYINFRDEIEKLIDIPDEVKSLWDYEFNSTTIEM